MGSFAQQPELQLIPMSQLALVRPNSFSAIDRQANIGEAVDKEDDWTGLTDAAARRKRQNRLNVRAYSKWSQIKLLPIAETPEYHRLCRLNLPILFLKFVRFC